MTGLVAIITGGSEGIGFAVAEKLAQDNVSCVLVARREQKLQAAVAQLGGESHSYVSADLLTPGAMAEVIAQVKNKYGRVDYLVNSAGIFLEKPLAETSMEEFRRLYDLNVFATVEGCKEAQPLMEAQDTGVIVNVSSMAGIKPYPSQTAYTSSKAAVNQFTKAFALDLKSGVYVLAIAPGAVDTPLLRRALEPHREELEKEVFKTFTLEEYYEKILKPSEVGDKIVDMLKNPQTYKEPIVEMPAYEF